MTEFRSISDNFKNIYLKFSSIIWNFASFSINVPNLASISIS